MQTGCEKFRVLEGELDGIEDLALQYQHTQCQYRGSRRGRVGADNVYLDLGQPADVIPLHIRYLQCI